MTNCSMIRLPGLIRIRVADSSTDKNTERRDARPFFIMQDYGCVESEKPLVASKIGRGAFRGSMGGQYSTFTGEADSDPVCQRKKISPPFYFNRLFTLYSDRIISLCIGPLGKKKKNLLLPMYTKG
ncbi:CW-type Zinc Finger [Striga asiatica]|uniref:CW-type Zinc Finger n=1 Tax=Striga asiatica TaxID=4170 RepID=A0A5A7QTD4_STRAF|nr:CW-type Zinc Finger [Striga asiatica]